MFSKPLVNLTLAGMDANEVFDNIYGETFGNKRDESFLATLRALLPNRMANNDHIGFSCRSANFREDFIRSATASSLLQYMNLPGSNEIVCYIVDCGGDNGNALLFEKIDSDEGRNYIENCIDFRELKDIKHYLSKYMDARCYINERAKSTMIMVSRPDYRNFHFLQSLTPRYLPWYFNNKPIDDSEKNLLRSLTERNATNYERIIEEIAQKIDFRQYKIKTMLSNFEKNARATQLESVKSEIRSNEQRIEQNVAEYMSLIESLDARRVRAAGLRSLIEAGSSESELVDYFLCNKNLSLVSTNGSVFTFIVKCYFDSFDPEMYSRISANERSDIYRYAKNGVFKTNEDIKLLFDAIMSDDPVLKVKMCAYYELDTRGRANAPSSFMYPRECRDYIPNPHIAYHSCLGNHKRYIEKALLEGDQIRAVEQCVSSAKSVNVAEGITFNRFVTDVCSSVKNVIELPDGTSKTPEKALQWLKNKNNAANNSEEGQNV